MIFLLVFYLLLEFLMIEKIAKEGLHLLKTFDSLNANVRHISYYGRRVVLRKKWELGRMIQNM